MSERTATDTDPVIAAVDGPPAGATRSNRMTKRRAPTPGRSRLTSTRTVPPSTDSTRWSARNSATSLGLAVTCPARSVVVDDSTCTAYDAADPGAGRYATTTWSS